MKLFGGPKKAPTPSVKESVLKIRENIEMLEKREKYFQTKIDKEIAEARANAQKNKRAALMALKRKKAYEKQIETMMATRINLESQLMLIDNAAMNVEVLNSMAAGNQALKTLHGSMNIDKVDAIMDDIQEQTQLANEIQNVLSTPLPGQEIDDDELLAELDQLEQQELDSKLLDVETPASAAADLSRAPAVPTTEPAIKTKKVVAPPVDDDEAELAELRASMAM